MLSKAERVLSAFEALMIAGAVVCITIIAVLASLDAILRYVISQPIGWVHDFVGLYMVTGAFSLVLSGTFAANGHMGVDLVVRRLRPRARRVLAVIADLLGIILFLPISYVMFQRSVGSFSSRSVLSGEIPWPTWPPAALLAFGCLVLVLRLLLHTAQAVTDQLPLASSELQEGERWN
jgi:TRAP-type C4-dicarboxylate transport system permease small subunit